MGHRRKLSPGKAGTAGVQAPQPSSWARGAQFSARSPVPQVAYGTDVPPTGHTGPILVPAAGAAAGLGVTGSQFVSLTARTGKPDPQRSPGCSEGHVCRADFTNSGDGIQFLQKASYNFISHTNTGAHSRPRLHSLTCAFRDVVVLGSPGFRGTLAPGDCEGQTAGTSMRWTTVPKCPRQRRDGHFVSIT